MLGSGNNLSRGVGSSSDVPPLPQCVPLEPIRLGNQKYPRSGELRRVLGVPSRTSSEDGSFGLVHPKPSPPVVTEELKHFKESVQDTSKEAGDRAKKLGDSIFRLDKYAEALTSKKRRRSDISPGERMDGVNLDKVRNQIPRTSDSMAQRSDERKKMFGLNKRARASVADVRGDGRVSALPRQQVTEKDSDALPGISGETMRIEEKIRRLPVGGEGWETKMKRKRSVATLGNRVMNSDQRALQPKLTADSKLRSCDTQNYRSKSSSAVCNRLDSSFEPQSPDVSTLSRNEFDTVTLARDRSGLSEPRLMARGINKRHLQDDNLANSSSAMLKRKISRAPRAGPIMAAEPSSRVESPSGALQGMEQSKGIDKVSAMALGDNQKLQMSAGSSPHAMAQWVGQRPHKNSRTRRTNVVSPVMKHAENKISSQGFATSDFSPRSSPGTIGSFSVVDNTSLKVKRELKNVSSPYGFSESEDSGAGDNKPREHGLESGEVTTTTQKTGALVHPIRKNKIHSGHNGDGTWKQGKGGSSLTNPGFHPINVKMENAPMEKSTQNVKIASDGNKSKTGRPPAKRLKDRKASTRVGLNANTVSSDVTGESDDDREDLFAAVNSARKAANHACSGKFWKKMDYIFASVSSEDTQYMKDQLSSMEELDESLREATAIGYNIMDALMPKSPQGPGDGDTVNFSNKASSISDLSFERLNMRKLNESTPLYKRVLSALIEEDDGEEVVQSGEGKNPSLHYASDDSHCGSCTHIDTEARERDRMESEVESNVEFQALKNCLFDRFSSDRSVASIPLRNGSVSVSVHSNEQWLGEDDLSHSEVALGGSDVCSNHLSHSQPREMNIPSFPSSDTQYQLMSLDERLLLELQSIGVYPEAMPDLAEETISSDVVELKENVYEQIRNKKKKLEKLNVTVQKSKDAERRKIEHLAMDQLVEMAHMKRVASRGSKASKVRKVSRQVALGFIKRTVARCRRFEETGRSCFADPALQDVLFSSPSNDAKSSDNGGSGTASNTLNELSTHQADARGSGAVYSTKRREALIDDVIGSASSKITTTTTTSRDSAVVPSGGGAKRDGERNKDGLGNEIKTKPKQKNGNRNSTRTTHPTGPSSRGPVAADAEGPLDFSSLAFDELDGVEEPADLGDWFDGLQDIDTMGLEIPMDDLSDVKLLV